MSKLNTLQLTLRDFIDGMLTMGDLKQEYLKSIEGSEVLRTTHLASTPATTDDQRPVVPWLSPSDFVKAKYSHGDKRCYTARMLDVFLPINGPHYVLAYREFRLATMDYLYANHADDHAATAEDRCKCWNTVATTLNYF